MLQHDNVIDDVTWNADSSQWARGSGPVCESPIHENPFGWVVGESQASDDNNNGDNDDDNVYWGLQELLQDDGLQRPPGVRMGDDHHAAACVCVYFKMYSIHFYIHLHIAFMFLYIVQKF